MFVLLLRTGILSQNQYRYEITLMEQLLREEKKQYQSVKENLKQIFKLSFHISANGDKSWILRLFRHLSYREILGISLYFSAYF